DTLWALSFLAQRGVAVFAVPVNTSADALHTEAMEAFQRAGGRVVTTIDPATDAVIDGVFGNGCRGRFNLPGCLGDHTRGMDGLSAWRGSGGENHRPCYRCRYRWRFWYRVSWKFQSARLSC